MNFKLFGLLLAVAVAFLPAYAEAGLVFGSGTATVVVTGGDGSPSNGTAEFDGTRDAAFLNITDHDTSETVTVSIALSPTERLQRDFILWTGGHIDTVLNPAFLGTVSVVSIVLTNSNGITISTNGSFGATALGFSAALNPTLANVRANRLTGSGTQANYGSSVAQRNTFFGTGGGPFPTITNITIGLTTSGFGLNESYQLDAIGNPEPGTVALFGLGAAALGAIVVRRRRHRAGSATSPEFVSPAANGAGAPATDARG